MTGEISSLKHEIRDDTVEGAASISLSSAQRHQQRSYKTILSSGQFTEVFCRLWDNIVIQLATQSKRKFQNDCLDARAPKQFKTGKCDLQDDSAERRLVYGDIEVNVCHICCSAISRLSFIDCSCWSCDESSES